MDSNLSTPDTRNTGEHFFGALAAEPLESTQVAQRVADLTTQLEFLDREIVRYREILERERIRHSTEIIDMQLQADTRLDEHRRQERHATQVLHDSYRALINTNQVEFDKALSEANTSSAAELAGERGRQQQLLERMNARRSEVVQANHKQAIDEINESHQRSRQPLENELAQAATTIERLEAELADQHERADRAEADAATAARETASVKHQIERIEGQQQARIHKADKQAADAIERVNTERKRSAATLAELLERSASIASEADKARSDFAAKQAEAEHNAAMANQRAQDEYRDVLAAADERVAHAMAREIELEGAIAELRNQLANGPQ